LLTGQPVNHAATTQLCRHLYEVMSILPDFTDDSRLSRLRVRAHHGKQVRGISGCTNCNQFAFIGNI